MKNKIIVTLAAVAIIGSLLLFIPLIATGKEKVKTITATTTVYIEKSLKPEQVIWMARLMKCESGIKETAINPNDVDNTPSWGILQFKPSTFDHFTVKYGIEGELMDPNAQVAVVMHWVLNPEQVTWSRQFPACVKMLGEPPL